MLYHMVLPTITCKVVCDRGALQYNWSAHCEAHTVRDVMQLACTVRDIC